MERELEERFWTTREIGQECLLNTLLFNILTADLEEEIGKVK